MAKTRFKRQRREELMSEALCGGTIGIMILGEKLQNYALMYLSTSLDCDGNPAYIPCFATRLSLKLGRIPPT